MAHEALTDEAAETHRRAVRLRPAVWRQFRDRHLQRGRSPATRIGELIELDVGLRTDANAMHFTTFERRLLWHVLALRLRTMPMRPNDRQTMRQVIAEFQATTRLRDRFADAFDPPMPTVVNPRVSAGSMRDCARRHGSSMPDKESTR